MSEPPAKKGGDREGWLERFALHRPELRAWALYDWANSTFWAVIIASVFPIYWTTVANEGSEQSIPRFTLVTSVSLLVVALIAPLLGAVADFSAAKKKLLGTFVLFGSLSTAAMFAIGPGDWVLASVLFGIANIGVAGSLVFSDSLLPTVARGKELDRVATSGFALGYLSGGLLLVLAIVVTKAPEVVGLSSDDATLPARVMFVVTALWWALFSIPILTRVREPARRLQPGESAGQNPLVAGVRRLGSTLHDVRRYKHAFAMLIAFLVYGDGVATIMRMAVIYGADLGIEGSELIGAVLLVQFVAVPFSLLFGGLAGRIGPKRAILIGLAIYVGICLYGWQMSTAREFYVLAFLVGTAQGGVQALSRSLFASMVPVHKAGEFFGVFGVLEKFAGVAGPALFGVVIAVTGSNSSGMIALTLFFLVGGALLSRVDVGAGRRMVAEES